MTDIPYARSVLENVLELDISDEARSKVEEALSHMTRSYVKQRSRKEAIKVTPELARSVLDFYHRYPDASCKKIGNTFGINQGRVSEIISGKHTS